MTKKDKSSMAEDYIAQTEWESSHPFDKRGRPSAKYQPKWKYQRAYPKPYKMPVLLWIILIPIVLAWGFYFSSGILNIPAMASSELSPFFPQ